MCLVVGMNNEKKLSKTLKRCIISTFAAVRHRACHLVLIKIESSQEKPLDNVVNLQ